MKKKRMLLLFTLLLICHASLKSQVLEINGLDYEKVDGKWYHLYQGYPFEVDQSTITVKFIDGASQNDKDNFVQLNNCSLILTNILGYSNLAVNDTLGAINLANILMTDTLIDYFEFNTFGAYLSHPNDPKYNDQWHLHDEQITGGIDAYKAWTKENGDPSVILGIIDSGTAILHADLEGNIWVNPGEDLDDDGIVWDPNDLNGIDDDDNGFIDDLVGWNFQTNRTRYSRFLTTMVHG